MQPLDHPRRLHLGLRSLWTFTQGKLRHLKKGKVQTHSHRLAMEPRLRARCRERFNGMRHGVPQIQNAPHSTLFGVFLDDVLLDLCGLLKELGPCQVSLR